MLYVQDTQASTRALQAPVDGSTRSGSRGGGIHFIFRFDGTRSRPNPRTDAPQPTATHASTRSCVAAAHGIATSHPFGGVFIFILFFFFYFRRPLIQNGGARKKDEIKKRLNPPGYWARILFFSPPLPSWTQSCGLGRSHRSALIGRTGSRVVISKPAPPVCPPPGTLLVFNHEGFINPNDTPRNSEPQRSSTGGLDHSSPIDTKLRRFLFISFHFVRLTFLSVLFCLVLVAIFIFHPSCASFFEQLDWLAEGGLHKRIRGGRETNRNTAYGGCGREGGERERERDVFATSV